MTKLYQKKPTPVEVLQHTGENSEEVHRFVCKGFDKHEFGSPVCDLRRTSAGVLQVWHLLQAEWNNVYVTDYIVRDKSGFSPVTKDYFEQYYEEVDSD